MTPRTRLAWLFALAACGAHPKHQVLAGGGGAPLQVASTGDPKLIAMKLEPTTDVVLASATSMIGVRVLVTADEIDRAKRPALNLGLVLDTSGSMDGDAIKALRDNAREMVGKLRNGDHVSVVVFHSRAEVLVPNTVVGEGNRAEILHAIEGIHATGTTALADGLGVGYQQLMAGQLPAGINRLVLFSDGIPNDATQIPNMLAQIHGSGVSVTSLGFGLDYDTALMTQIARDTGGAFHYIEKPTEVAQVFDEELSKMTMIVGRNLVLRLQPGPGVTIHALPNLQPIGGGAFQTTIGDLAGGESRDLMIPIDVTSRAEGSTVELVEATLMFEDVIGHSGGQQREAYLGLKTSADAAKVQAAIKVSLESARIRANASAAILEAIGLARQGQLPQAKKVLAEAIKDVKAAAKDYPKEDFKKLVEELESVSRQVATMVPPQNGLQIGNANVLQGEPRPMAPVTAAPAVERDLRRTEESATERVQGITPR
jgi:Ca-activated chloride channel family protein